MTTPGSAIRTPPERALRALVFGAVGIGAMLLAWYFGRLVAYLAVGMLLAYLMRPAADWVQGFGFGRIPSILAAFVLLFGLLALLLTYLVPFVAGQISAVLSQLSPDSVARTIAYRIAAAVPLDAERLREGLYGAMAALVREDRVPQIVGSVFDLFANIFYAVLVIPFVTFFFLKDGPRLRATVLSMVPNRYFEITLGIMEKVKATIGRYFVALLLQSLAITAVTTVGLTVAGLDYALAVGVFTGLANTIPYFGPIIGVAAGTVVGISQTGDLSLVTGVLAAMAVTQLTDNLLLQPLIFSRAARTHPLVILFVVLIGAQVAGIVGMLVAIPLTTTIRVVLTEIIWSMRTYRILRAA